MITTTTKITVAAGVVASLLTGSIWASLNDTVEFTDNNASTSTLTGVDIEVALTPEDEPCDSPFITYEEGPFEQAFRTIFDLEAGYHKYLSGNGYFWGTTQPRSSGGAAFGTQASMCVRNNGDVALDISVETVEHSNREQGDCQPSEVEAGDTTCGMGQQGEITGVAFYSGGYGNCSFLVERWDLGETKEISSRTMGLPANTACPLRITPTLDISDDDAYIRAQSDVLNFDLRLVAERRG